MGYREGQPKKKEKKKQQAITGWFTFFLFTRHFAMLLLTTCIAEKIYLGLPFSLPLSGRITVPCLPQSFSLTQVPPHPYSSRMSLSL